MSADNVTYQDRVSGASDGRAGEADVPGARAGEADVPRARAVRTVWQPQSLERLTGNEWLPSAQEDSPGFSDFLFR